VSLPFDFRNTRAGDYKQPLIGAAMAIVRTALCLAGLNDHLSRLTAAISKRNSKSFAEAQGFAFHEVCTFQLECVTES
jgi:hypothetical protein